MERVNNVEKLAVICNPVSRGMFSSTKIEIINSLKFAVANVSTSRGGGDSPLSKWRIHLLKGLVQIAVSQHLQTFGE
jgi:hypothetical protein